ncbi:MAG: carboxymuconolactone decarboxylase family protein [Bacillota bacterium]
MSDSHYGKSDLRNLKKLAQLEPEVFQALTGATQKAIADGELSTKVKELIAVACAHITRCPWCIEGHTKAAKKAGATEKELTEAIMVAVNLAAGASLAHAAIAMKTFEES